MRFVQAAVLCALPLLGTSARGADRGELAIGLNIDRSGLFVEFVRVTEASACAAGGPNTITSSPILWPDDGSHAAVAAAFGGTGAELLGARFAPGARKDVPRLRAGVRLGSERVLVGLAAEAAEKGAPPPAVAITAQRIGADAPFLNVRAKLVPSGTTLVARSVDGPASECLLIALTPVPGAGSLADAIRVRPAAPVDSMTANGRPERRISGDEPEYPRDAVRTGAKVKLLLVEERDSRGRVAVVSQTGPPPPAEFALPAITAALGWEYEPALRDGKAVRAYGVTTVRFEVF